MRAGDTWSGATAGWRWLLLLQLQLLLSWEVKLTTVVVEW